VDSLYISYLLSYNRALKQKNFLLKTKRNTGELRSWNKTISELSEKLVGIKMKFVERLNEEIENKFDHRLNLAYRPSLDVSKGVGGSIFFEELESLKSSEMTAQRSLKGPHLDHFSIRLKDNDLKVYSSGEKKIHLLMLYISFIEMFKGIKSEYPVFLVDDFDIAIDKNNIDFLMKNYPDMQVIATSVNGNIDFERQIELKKEN
jgi:recombinational DNA repair ATPase RecF